MNWHTNPPEWAAYVGHVMLAARESELHFDVDMACKRVDVDCVACEGGKVVITFHTDLSEDVGARPRGGVQRAASRDLRGGRGDRRALPVSGGHGAAPAGIGAAVWPADPGGAGVGLAGGRGAVASPCGRTDDPV